MNFSLGIDFGTSGARAIAIDPAGQIQATARVAFAIAAEATPMAWQAALWSLLQQLPRSVRLQIQAIAINGTSSTVLLCDAQGQPVVPPLLYHDRRGQASLAQIQAIAPPEHVVLSASSSLAKLLWWQAQGALTHPPLYFLHQADWLGFCLHGQLGHSDYHNVLKLGYDVAALTYPDWLLDLQLPVHLPQVHAPGTAIGPLRPAIATQFDLPSACVVRTGTTDSIAAFLASGAQTPGEAVTSLGSTLVLKLLSPTRIEAAAWGLYSHRWGNLWLVGGASNTGGAVLRSLFTPAQLISLSDRIDPTQASPLHYYPLLTPGERFPIADPQLPPCLEPRPADDVAFLHGLLESLARIEAQGYHLLQTWGAPPLQRVFTAGGGAQNNTWTALRARYLQVPVTRSPQTEAAYGTARLAQGLTPP